MRRHAPLAQRALMSQAVYCCHMIGLVIFSYQFIANEEGAPMEMPAPDTGILSRKEQDRGATQGRIASAAVIHDAAEVKAYECDALTALYLPAACRGAARLDRGRGDRPSHLPRRGRAWWCRADRAPRWPVGRCRRPTA